MLDYILLCSPGTVIELAGGQSAVDKARGAILATRAMGGRVTTMFGNSCISVTDISSDELLFEMPENPIEKIGHVPIKHLVRPGHVLKLNIEKQPLVIRRVLLPDWVYTYINGQLVDGAHSTNWRSILESLFPDADIRSFEPDDEEAWEAGPEKWTKEMEDQL